MKRGVEVGVGLAPVLVSSAENVLHDANRVLDTPCFVSKFPNVLSVH